VAQYDGKDAKHILCCEHTTFQNSAQC